MHFRAQKRPNRVLEGFRVRDGSNAPEAAVEDEAAAAADAGAPPPVRQVHRQLRRHQERVRRQRPAQPRDLGHKHRFQGIALLT